MSVSDVEKMSRNIFVIASLLSGATFYQKLQFTAHFLFCLIIKSVASLGEVVAINLLVSMTVRMTGSEYVHGPTFDPPEWFCIQQVHSFRQIMCESNHGRSVTGRSEGMPL